MPAEIVEEDAVLASGWPRHPPAPGEAGQISASDRVWVERAELTVQADMRMSLCLKVMPRLCGGLNAGIRISDDHVIAARPIVERG